MQSDLFGHIKQSNKEVTLDKAQKIIGLRLYFDFITKEDENLLIEKIDNSPWLKDLSRRVQHYGYKYDYKARKIDRSFYLGDLPDWLNQIAVRLYNDRLLGYMPNQAIINEYECGQGIAPHIDCEPCFGDTIVSLSLGATCIMNFEKQPHAKDKVELLVEPRSLIVMTKESRYDWYHGIPQRKNDKFNGVSIKRQRRISITFRKVVLQ